MTNCGLVYNDDARDWTAYIKEALMDNNKCGDGDKVIEIQSFLDTDILQQTIGNSISYLTKPSCVTIFVLSPGHLDFLVKNNTANFHFLTEPSRCVLFYLGVEPNDILHEKLDTRYPQFEQCNSVFSTDPNGVAGFVAKLLNVINNVAEISSDTSSSTIQDSNSSGSSGDFPQKPERKPSTKLAKAPFMQELGAALQKKGPKLSPKPKQPDTSKQSDTSQQPEETSKPQIQDSKTQPQRHITPRPKPQVLPKAYRKDTQDNKTESSSQSSKTALESTNDPSHQEPVPQEAPSESAKIPTKTVVHQNTTKDSVSAEKPVTSKNGKRGKRRDKGRNIKLHLLPLVVSCENKTRLVLTSHDPIEEDDSDILITILNRENPEDGFTISSENLERINPYTIAFTVPEHRECRMDVKLMDHKQEIGKAEFNYKSYCDELQLSNQLYLELLSRITPHCNKSILEELDKEMGNVFDAMCDDDVPVKAFEQLFGIYEYSNEYESSQQKLPTLLHYAARFGLSNLADKLLNLNCAFLTFSMTNEDGHTPSDLAGKYGHSALRENLQVAEINDAYDSYVLMQSYGYPRYLNNGGLTTIGKDGYVVTKGPSSHPRAPDTRPEDIKVDFPYFELKGTAKERDIQPGYMTMGVGGAPLLDGQVANSETAAQEEYTEVDFSDNPTPKPAESPSVEQCTYEVCGAEVGSQQGLLRSNDLMCPPEQTESAEQLAMKELADIGQRVKNGSLTLNDGSMLFDDWKRQHPNLMKIRQQNAIEIKHMQQLQKLSENVQQPKPPKRSGFTFPFSRKSNAQEKKKLRENIHVKEETKRYVRHQPGPVQEVVQEVYEDVNRLSTTSNSSAGSRDSRSSVLSTSSHLDSGVDLSTLPTISQQLRSPPPIPPRTRGGDEEEDSESGSGEEYEYVSEPYISKLKDKPPTASPKCSNRPLPSEPKEGTPPPRPPRKEERMGYGKQW